MWLCLSPVNKIMSGEEYTWGYYGPIYKITKDLDDKPFADKVELIKHTDQKISYEDAKKLWKRVKPENC